jgi:hypothetical protein
MLLTPSCSEPSRRRNRDITETDGLPLASGLYRLLKATPFIDLNPEDVHRISLQGTFHEYRFACLTDSFLQARSIHFHAQSLRPIVGMA